MTYNLTSRTPTLSPTKLYLQNCCKSPKSKSEIYKLSSKNDDHREQRYANEGGSHPRGADLAPLRRNAGSPLKAYKIEWETGFSLWKAELQKPAGVFWKPAHVNSTESIHRAFRFKQIYQENGIDWPLELTPFAMIWSADEKSCKDFFFRKSRVIRKGTINSGLDNRHKMRPAKLGLCSPPSEALTCKLLRDTE